ncbi:hypothetical protein ABFS82_06G007600 [Erythranthe guttata]|uniref:Phytocyanin domain-containing protein n=1 Tax=Erythranthe guttata TaxID=4155 RepID=A0A022RY12_ERYGU|nr:PREDICTED: mavicyanin-like [Erythranthe guttata]EYU45397.1 hypothetical protein MIMGU_mgv1a014864mg [Erythranthe guttata]|eukprot:XP_012844343.1 PREDICTED: mavicyanin-like [Erythranthe guttata]
MKICGKFVLLLLVILVTVFEKRALAKKHVVGGSQGWDESTDFDSWASAQTFNVGDELEFKYTPGLHSVVELGSESALKSCDVGSSLNSLSSGSDTIKLSKAGTRYFACGTSGHCGQGMKVKITTVAADSSSSSSSTTTTSPPGAAHSVSASSDRFQFLGLFASIASFVASAVLFV